MARIIVRAVDSPGAEDMKRGNVVEVLPDGASLGKKVEGNPRWRVIEVPGASVASMEYLKAREALPPDSLKRPLARRTKLNLDAMEAVEVARKGQLLVAGDIIAATKTALDARLIETLAPEADVVLPPEEEKP